MQRDGVFFVIDDGTFGLVVKRESIQIQVCLAFLPSNNSEVFVIVLGFLNIFGCGWGPRKVFDQETARRKHVPDLLAHCSQSGEPILAILSCHPCKKYRRSHSFPCHSIGEEI